MSLTPKEKDALAVYDIAIDELTTRLGRELNGDELENLAGSYPEAMQAQNKWSGLFDYYLKPENLNKGKKG